MKTKYEEASMEIVFMTSESIVTTSGGLSNGGSGSGSSSTLADIMKDLNGTQF